MKEPQDRRAVGSDDTESLASDDVPLAVFRPKLVELLEREAKGIFAYEAKHPPDDSEPPIHFSASKEELMRPILQARALLGADTDDTDEIDDNLSLLIAALAKEAQELLQIRSREQSRGKTVRELFRDHVQETRQAIVELVSQIDDISKIVESCVGSIHSPRLS